MTASYSHPERFRWRLTVHKLGGNERTRTMRGVFCARPALVFAIKLVIVVGRPVAMTYPELGRKHVKIVIESEVP
jgi:hypothetical protein